MKDDPSADFRVLRSEGNAPDIISESPFYTGIVVFTTIPFPILAMIEVVSHLSAIPSSTTSLSRRNDAAYAFVTEMGMDIIGVISFVHAVHFRQNQAIFREICHIKCVSPPSRAKSKRQNPPFRGIQAQLQSFLSLESGEALDVMLARIVPAQPSGIDCTILCGLEACRQRSQLVFKPKRQTFDELLEC